MRRVGLVAEALARLSASLIGSARLRAEWELENIAVAPDSHGQGVGTALMEALVPARFEDVRRNQLLLEVRESNLGARRLYEKAGFEAVGAAENVLSLASGGCPPF